MIRSSTGCAPTRLPMIFPCGTGGVIARNFGHACNVLQIKQDELDQEIACRRNRTQQNWDSSVRGKIRFPATYKVRPRIAPRPAGRAGVHPPKQYQVPIIVIAVPAVKRLARRFGGSTTTPSQTIRFTSCPLTLHRTLNSSVSYLGSVSPGFGGSNLLRP